MKHVLIALILMLGLSCSFMDEEAAYVERLTVFGQLQANQPMRDPVYVSRSSSIEEQIPSSELYVAGALVKIINGDSTWIAAPVVGAIGQYRTGPEVIYQAGETYRLEVSHQGDTVWAETTIPEAIDFTSPEGGTFNCDGQEIGIGNIEVNNMDPATFLPNGSIDTLFYRSGGCYTQSFASYPYFTLDFLQNTYGTVQIITVALEADRKGLEPFSDENGNGLPDSGEPFTDFNRNGVRDSSFTNLIYDTTTTNILWKGNYLRDEENNPYRYNPFVWNVENPPVPMSWLFFNYYGLHLVLVQSTDSPLSNYLSGDPLGVNQYRLPDSNIEGGYGLFTSAFVRGFFLFVAPYEEE